MRWMDSHLPTGFPDRVCGRLGSGGALSAKARSLNPHHPGWIGLFRASMRIEEATTKLHWLSLAR